LLCEVYGAQGKHDEAAKLLEQMVADPANYTPQYTKMRLKTDLGWEYQCLHKSDKALSSANDAFSDMKNLDNFSAVGIVTRLRLAELYRGLKEVGRAEEVFAAAGVAVKSLILADDREWPFIGERLSAVKEALAKGPSNEETTLGKMATSSWIWHDDLVDERQSARTRELFNHAKQVIDKGDFKRGLALSNDLLLREHAVRAFSLRAEAYMGLKQYQKAIDDLSKAIARRPNRVRPHLMRARAYEETHQYQLALNDYSAAIRLDETADALTARAGVYRKLGNLPLANADMIRASQLQIRPQS
jgi:tetratricopeptide (TPR) repeat protein